MYDTDTFNLRNNAKFCLSICNNVSWVPFSELGKSQYQNKNLLVQGNADIYIKLNNPYEIIQYIQNNNFTIKNNSKYMIKYGLRWSIPLKGKELLEMKCGDCAAYSGLLYYLLKEQYQEVGILCIMSDTGQGHALNYIFTKRNYYFIDLFAQLPENYLLIPIEDGLRSTFSKAKYITGACLKAPSIDDYIIFLERHNRLKKRTYFYFLCKGNRIPMSAFIREGEVLNVILEKDESIQIIRCNSDKIKYKIIDWKGSPHV